MSKNPFTRIRGKVSNARLRETTEKLWLVERGRTFDDYQKSTRYAESLMVEAGLSGVERITFPAIG